MRFYILLQIISLLSSAPKPSLRAPILTLTLCIKCPLLNPMALSKPILDGTEGVDLEYIRYDYDANWDSCDYVDPSTLPDNINVQDLVVLQWNLR